MDSNPDKCKSEASLLLNLAFTTVGYDSDNMKSIGFDLIISVIDLLSQVTDRVQDDMDDEEE